MDPADLDRILRDDPVIDPSPNFSSRVMRSVRQQASRADAMPFPWHLFILGLGVTALMMAVPAMTGASAKISSDVTDAIQWITLALSGTFITAWASRRLVRQ